MSEERLSLVEDATGPSASDRSKAYTKANARLRAAHQAEFDALLVEEYAAIGGVPRRRKTHEEREAEAQARVDAAAAKVEARRQAAIKKHQDAIAALQGLVNEDPL